ncbi:hypothetical protein ACNSPU_15035 [Bacillus velezensis]
MKQLIHWIKQPSISKPLIAAFLAVLVLPVGILAYFSYQTAGEFTRKRTDPQRPGKCQRTEQRAGKHA